MLDKQGLGATAGSDSSLGFRVEAAAEQEVLVPELYTEVCFKLTVTPCKRLCSGANNNPPWIVKWTHASRAGFNLRALRSF